MPLKRIVVGLFIILLCVTSLMAQTHDFTYSSSQRFSYTTDELRDAGKTKAMGSLAGLFCSNLTKEIRRRERGRPGGLKRRLRSRKCKPYLPSVLRGNVRSIRNKCDELTEMFVTLMHSGIYLFCLLRKPC